MLRSALRPRPDYFNPRSPHGERHAVWRRSTRSSEFQSTLPAWGATPASADRAPLPSNFNPRSPHGERPPLCLAFLDFLYFNPRSPHGERHRRRRSTGLPWISIHAPRMGSDIRLKRSRSIKYNFNPRSPHGERHARFNRAFRYAQFQSTLPAWGATSW